MTRMIQRGGIHIDIVSGRARHNPQPFTFTGILHETRKPARLAYVTVNDIKEAAALSPFGTPHRELHVFGKADHWYRVRASGRLRTWKRDPERVELPVKYGLYESLTLTSYDFKSGRVAVVIE